MFVNQDRSDRPRRRMRPAVLFLAAVLTVSTGCNLSKVTALMGSAALIATAVLAPITLPLAVGLGAAGGGLGVAALMDGDKDDDDDDDRQVGNFVPAPAPRRLPPEDRHYHGSRSIPGWRDGDLVIEPASSHTGETDRFVNHTTEVHSHRVDLFEGDWDPVENPDGTLTMHGPDGTRILFGPDGEVITERGMDS